MQTRKEYAGEIALTVSIRRMVNGSSVDEVRESTPEEATLIYKIALSAISAMNDYVCRNRVEIECGRNFDELSAAVRAAIDAAENALIYFTTKDSDDWYEEWEREHINTYDSMFLPLHDNFMITGYSLDKKEQLRKEYQDFFGADGVNGACVKFGIFYFEKYSDSDFDILFHTFGYDVMREAIVDAKNRRWCSEYSTWCD